MKINFNLILVVAATLYFPNALALDPSAAIKVTPLIKATQSWDNKPITYPKGQAEITGLIIEIAPGAETNWHQHPVPSFAMILQGTLEIKLRDGRVKRLQTGEAAIEVVDTDHIGRNVGDTPLKLVVFYAGTVGQVLTINKP